MERKILPLFRRKGIVGTEIVTGPSEADLAKARRRASVPERVDRYWNKRLTERNAEIARRGFTS